MPQDRNLFAGVFLKKGAGADEETETSNQSCANRFTQIKEQNDYVPDGNQFFL